MREQRARIRRLAVWFSLNFIIFIVCYLNYRLQLKHRYLYKTLNAGLCFSRAAAMVINFNLLLVWLPMCKYSLTWLACLATSALKRHRNERFELANQQLGRMEEQKRNLQLEKRHLENNNEKFSFETLVKSLRLSVREATGVLRQRLNWAKINSINSFLVAVDHCKSLHTICATTITLASENTNRDEQRLTMTQHAVIHTVAHLINVMNFSRNFDPLLSNLNMADYKGQNPFQLLISIPGITGSLMMLILIFMSLSSIDFIRNSFYDLFQIFHRLSVIFVILLLLHPASHVIKEQSNVERHHPDLCYQQMLLREQQQNLTQVSPEFLAGGSPLNGNYERDLTVAATTTTGVHLPFKDNANAARVENANALANSNPQSIPSASDDHQRSPTSSARSGNKTAADLNVIRPDNQRPPALHEPSLAQAVASKPAAGAGAGVGAGKSQGFGGERGREREQEGGRADRFCLDPRPLFVAQSSICWYVLAVGLSCYLLDLLLRRLRRSKSSIELLGARQDAEQNLVELVLSNNHRRFAHWVPGQFVYLNCPQIAAYEWHPFTISSMDETSRQFTLHIKTGGDWTRKLRQRLCSCGSSRQPLSYQQQEKSRPESNLSLGFSVRNHQILPDLSPYNRQGQLQVTLVRIKHTIDNESYFDHKEDENNDDKSAIKQQVPTDLEAGLKLSKTIAQNLQLDLYIDGPFHSPFERLLEQQVSVCIANGVGWTAFSSVFQCIANQHWVGNGNESDCWWAKWRHFARQSQATQGATANATRPQLALGKSSKLIETKLHLMVIVTSLEQLKPFYQLAIDYFKRLEEELGASTPMANGKADSESNQQCTDVTVDLLNPVKEITAFITRSSGADQTVQEFCRKENLCALAASYDNRDNEAIRVNNLFTIRFGKPQFDLYLSSLGALYQERPKVSVYCCGSYQVKRDVRQICHSLNRLSRRPPSREVATRKGPLFSYHEENF